MSSPATPAPGLQQAVLGDWRGRFPFTLAAPSWVLPLETDNFVGNVAWLSDKVDRVQILCFGKDYVDELLNPTDLARLVAIRRDSDLRFSVHLPADLGLLTPEISDEELASRLEVLAHVYEICAGLEPESFILHLDSPPGIVLSPEVRAMAASRALAGLAKRLPDASQRFLVENTAWNLRIAANHLAEAGFGVCADFGHLHQHGLSIPDFLGTFGPSIREVHLHGFDASGDHLPLAAMDNPTLEAIIAFLKEHHPAVTVENFRADYLQSSLSTLARLW